MVIITGTSQGIGKVLAERFLKEEQTVIGIGRNHSITHPNYQAITCDLSDPNAVTDLVIPISNEPTTFIHNAGILGQVNRFSDQYSPDFMEVMQVNLNSGINLIHKIIRQIPLRQQLDVVAISSGAAKRAIPSWAAYCSSKAALEMWMQTVYLEEIELGRNTRFYAVAPGVVDTRMQTEIRQVNSSNFSSIEQFRQFKEENQLLTPETVADKLFKLLKMNYSGQVSYLLKDVE